MLKFVDKAPDVFAAVCTLGILACILFPLRIWVRVSKKAWGYDDWFMLAGFLPFLALTISCLIGPFHGLGVHQNRLSDEEKEDGMKWFFLFEIFFCIAIIFIKLSISFMLARIASPFRGYVYALWTAAALVTLANLIALFYIVFRCTAVSYAWDMSTPGGSCQPSQHLAAIYYADTAVNIATDWFCAFLPIPILWNLQMNRNAKLSVAVLLSLGVVASVSACIRLRYTVKLNESEDFLFAIGDVVIWGYAENAFGVIVGCISTLRPLFVRVLNLGDPSSGKTRSGHVQLPAIAPQRGQPGHARGKESDSKGGIVKSVQLRAESGDLGSESEDELVRNIRGGYRW